MDKLKMKEIRKQVRSAELISQAKELLRENGYYIYSLYHIEDVQSHYECTDAEAMDILDQALDNDGTANQVWESIRYFAEDMGLKEKED